ncbi:MAG: hypothetical protein HYZ11_03055 [Candidatus Tectomicrobia bacterium]|uniref:vWA-MoxR associated protein middle region 5 domain-containing protein n=1 Tax=Tectimicrobiota bacterium TaxID=2528274 RepID=A0A932MKY3_UNCTE|nr:hypothetical protein [Candidatus Tectomicrobia bacterium]
MKAEPVLAKLNDLRKDAQGEESVEEAALHHAFCYVSYQAGPFAEFVEKEKPPAAKKNTPPGERAREYLEALKRLRDEAAGDASDMEFIALDRAAGFISRTLGDFQAYLDEAGEGR